MFATHCSFKEGIMKKKRVGGLSQKTTVLSRILVYLFSEQFRSNFLRKKIFHRGFFLYPKQYKSGKIKL